MDGVGINALIWSFICGSYVFGVYKSGYEDAIRVIQNDIFLGPLCHNYKQSLFVLTAHRFDNCVKRII